MKILLVVATESEIIEEYFSDIDVLITGLGMVSATFELTKKLMQKETDLVINFGVAGSFNSKINIGDVVEVVEDNLSEIGYENGANFSQFTDFKVTTSYKVDSRTSLQKVRGITVNTVHGNENSILKIKDRLNPDIESMEGAAIFKVCKEFNVPCLQIRSISNKVERRNKENWNFPLAVKKLNLEVKKIILDI